MQRVLDWVWPALLATALGLGVVNFIRPTPTPVKPPEPKPAPLVEPTTDNPLIAPKEVVIPDRGMIRLPLKTLGAVRVVTYPGTEKHLQIEQFGGDILLSRRSQVAEDVYLGLQSDHGGKVGPVLWVLAKMGLAPQPPPTPEPEPEPKPDPKPKPVPLPPIPSDGPRVLVIYEATTGGPALTREQKSELNSAAFADYLNAKCVKEGQHPAWRIWDKDVTGLDNAPQWWRDTMSRPRASIPWLIVTDGVNSFAGPLPAGGEILTKIKSVLER